MTQGVSRILPAVDSTILHFASDMAALSSDHVEPPTYARSRLESETFKIRFARSHEQQRSATFLVQKLYGSRGYEIDGTSPALRETLDRITLLLNGKDNLPVGTITLAADGPDGLLADELYRPELDALRSNESIKLLEMTKFAMDRHRGNSRQVLATLICVAFLHTRLMGCNWVVIEVNPRHVGFYENNLGFKVIGRERVCPRVNAPAVLLGIDMAYVTEQSRKFGGRKSDPEAGNGLYRYFLNEEEEAGLVRRLFGQP